MLFQEAAEVVKETAPEVLSLSVWGLEVAGTFLEWLTFGLILATAIAGAIAWIVEHKRKVKVEDRNHDLAKRLADLEVKKFGLKRQKFALAVRTTEQELPILKGEVLAYQEQQLLPKKEEAAAAPERVVTIYVGTDRSNYWKTNMLYMTTGDVMVWLRHKGIGADANNYGKVWAYFDRDGRLVPWTTATELGLPERLVGKELNLLIGPFTSDDPTSSNRY